MSSRIGLCEKRQATAANTAVVHELCWLVRVVSRDIWQNQLSRIDHYMTVTCRVTARWPWSWSDRPLWLYDSTNIELACWSDEPKFTCLMGIAEFAGLEFAGLENDGVEQEQTYILHRIKWTQTYKSKYISYAALKVIRVLFEGLAATMSSTALTHRVST